MEPLDAQRLRSLHRPTAYDQLMTALDSGIAIANFQGDKRSL